MYVRRFNLPKIARLVRIPLPSTAAIALPVAVGVMAATIAVAAPTPAHAADNLIELKPAAMTYTNRAAPKTVYGGASDTIVSRSQHATYLRFDTSKLAPNTTIVSAELQVTVTTSQAKAPGLSVTSTAATSADSAMTYQKMSYQTRPAVTSGSLNPDEKAVALAGKTVTTELTGLAGTKVQPVLGLRVSYMARGLPVHLSKSDSPVLRLKVNAALAQTSTFVVGETKPDASNTGPAGLGLSSFTASGDVKTTAAGQTISGKNIAGYVNVNHNNTTVRGNIIRGRNAGTFVQSALVKVAPGVTGTIIEYNEIYEYATIGYWQNAVTGSNYTARRNNVHDVVDMFGVDAGGVVIEANYMHAFSFQSNDRDQAADKVHPYWSHNDSVQIKGGKSTTIRGNNIQMYASKTTGTLDAPTAYNYGAGITVSPNKSAVTDLLITANWIAGGEAGFQSNYFYNGGSSVNLGTISNNRMSHDQHYYAIRYKAGSTVAGGTTNYWDPDAPSVPSNLAGVKLSYTKGGGLQIDQ